MTSLRMRMKTMAILTLLVTGAMAESGGLDPVLRAVETTATFATARLTWNTFIKGAPPDDGVPTEIVIKCGTVSGVYTASTTTIPATQPSIALKDFLPGPGRYFCTIVGKNSDGEGPASAELPFAARAGNLAAYKGLRLE